MQGIAARASRTSQDSRCLWRRMGGLEGSATYHLCRMQNVLIQSNEKRSQHVLNTSGIPYTCSFLSHKRQLLIDPACPALWNGDCPVRFSERQMKAPDLARRFRQACCRDDTISSHCRRKSNLTQLSCRRIPRRRDDGSGSNDRGWRAPVPFFEIPPQATCGY